MAVAAGALALALAAPAGGAGVGNVELTPDPPPGAPLGSATVFHVVVLRRGVTTTAFQLHSTATDTVTVRLYAADAIRKPDGSFSVGDAGRVAWVRLDDQTVTIAPDATKRFAFDIVDPGVPEGSEAYAAIVEEVSQGALNLRAATVVYAKVPKPAGLIRRHLPLVLALAALVSLVIVGTAQFQARRVRRLPGRSVSRQ